MSESTLKATALFTHYIVLSPKPCYYSLTRKLASHIVKNHERCIVIKEMGTKGDHPHLNLFVSSTKRVDNLRRAILNTKRFTELFENNPRLVSCKTITNLEGLTHYNTKEDGYKVLYEKGVTLEQFKQQIKFDESKANPFKKSRKPRIKHLSKLDALAIIKDKATGMGKNLTIFEDYIDVLLEVNKDYSLIHFKRDELFRLRVFSMPNSKALRDYLQDASATKMERKMLEVSKRIAQHQNGLKIE